MKVAIVNCFDTFMDRQQALMDFFHARGDSVTAFLSDFQHRSKSAWPSAPEGYTLIHGLPYQKNLSIRRMYSHSKFARTVKDALAQEKWDLIWILVPPNSLVKQCAQYKRTHPDTKLVFDVNDLWPESFPLGGLKSLPPFQMWRSLRDNYLMEADYVVTECNLFRKQLKLDRYDNTSTIYFCKPEEKQILDRTAVLSEKHFSICYLGSINHIIDIDAIVAILSSIRKVRPVYLHIIGDGESKSQLIDRVQQAEVEVIDHGTVYNAPEKQAVFNQCHFGLNVMKPTVCVGLTMKSIDYLAGALPIINSIPGDTWDLIERNGFGLNWDESRKIDWLSFNQTQARLAARKFFEEELSYRSFSDHMESVLANI